MLAALVVCAAAAVAAAAAVVVLCGERGWFVCVILFCKITEIGTDRDLSVFVSVFVSLSVSSHASSPVSHGDFLFLFFGYRKSTVTVSLCFLSYVCRFACTSDRSIFTLPLPRCHLLIVSAANPVYHRMPRGRSKTAPCERSTLPAIRIGCYLLLRERLGWPPVQGPLGTSQVHPVEGSFLSFPAQR